jgi:enoyl-CoA hydratase/carnithine racemase
MILVKPQRANEMAAKTALERLAALPPDTFRLMQRAAQRKREKAGLSKYYYKEKGE